MIYIERMLLAVVCGTMIGMEREFYHKSAGLRTHILVTFGAAVFTMVSLSDFFTGLPVTPHILSSVGKGNDPARVAAQIVSGIGFIGGGAVLKYGSSVRGLTTAASIWNAGSIGMLVGIGLTDLAFTASAFTVLVLFFVGKLEQKFLNKRLKEYNRLQVELSLNPLQARKTLKWMDTKFKQDIIEVKAQENFDKEEVELNYMINCGNLNINLHELATQISRSQGVNRVMVKTFLEKEE